jgi:hypothetical protein
MARASRRKPLVSEDGDSVDDLIGPEPPGVVAGLTYEEREDEFLRLLKAGCSVRNAAAAVSMNFASLYRKRRNNPEFAKRWENAQRIEVADLVREAERRAMRKSDRLLMFLLQAADPTRFRQQSSIDVTNSDGSLREGEGDAAARTAALLATARARKAAVEVSDLL